MKKMYTQKQKDTMIKKEKNKDTQDSHLKKKKKSPSYATNA